jgi:hypothetical protein
MVTRIFWILFGVEAVAFTVLILWALLSSKHWGPEGPVGAWLIVVVPPLILGVPLAVFLIGKSEHARLIAVVLLALPLLQCVLGPIYTAVEDYRARRHVEGDATFTKPAERKLAHAFRAHDAELVKSLIPQVGDLNAGHGNDDSLFRFCMTNLDKSEASFEIVKAMLAAGANAKAEMAGGTFPLYWGIGWGRAMTELLLNAGADPNSLDHGRPIWWEAMEGPSSEEKLQSLRILLDREADMTLRHGENGPVGFAAHRKNWQAVWLLIERGAAWKDELAFGTPIPRLLALDLEAHRSAAGAPVPDELLQLAALFEGQEEAR